MKERFDLDINQKNLTFIKIPSGGKSLKPENYPSWTMLWQAIASVKVAFEAFVKGAPCDIWVDTMGVGYAYPFMKIFFGVKIVTYTHYPLVSIDMMRVVLSGTT